MISTSSNPRPNLARRARRAAALALAAGLLAPAGNARAQSTIGTPDVSGDQLIFFFDARAGRVPFLTVSNPSNATVEIEVAFYPTSLASRLGTQTYTLPAASNVVIDPSSSDIAGGAANGNAGIAVVTPVQAAGSTQAVVPPEPLTGGYTLANTVLSAAFGENPYGRFAVGNSGARAAAGAAVNGSTVKYQRFVPAVLMVPVHFNPASLADPSQDGNRVVLVAFADKYGAKFDVGPAAESAPVSFLDANGVEVASGTANVNGVLLTTLQQLASPATLNRSGKVFIDVNPGANNVFGLFSQSLGTFASGQRMPAVRIVPEGNPAPTGTPTPSPTPTKTGGTPTPVPTGGGACSKANVTITAAFAPGDSDPIAGVTALVNYPEAKVAIPGFGGEQSVLDRLTNLTGISSGIFSGGDDDSIINVGLVAIGANIPPGNFARVQFDCVPGQAAPAAGEFTCAAEVSSFLGLSVPGTCSVTVALQ